MRFPFRRQPAAPDAAAVLRAIEATPVLREAIVEAYGGFADPDANLSATQGGSQFFRGMLDSGRDLPEYDHKRILETAYYLADHNPLGKRIVNVWKNYTIGSGLTYAVDESAKDAEAITKCLDRFWDSPHNKVKLRLPMRMRALSITGEQCWPVAVDSVGQVRLGYVAPETIAAVLKDPHNGDASAAVVLEAKDAEGNAIVLKVVAISDKLVDGTHGRRMGVIEGETFTFPKAGTSGGDLTGTYAGACFFWRVNSLPNASRGRSDLLAAINPMDAYESVLMNDVDRTLLQKSFAWDVTLDGASAQEVDAWRLKHKTPPKPGTVLVHNQSEIWEPKNPDLHMVDAAAGADLILSYVATGTEMPKSWLNGLMDVNRATADAMPEPTYMALEERQTFVQDMLTEVLCFALDQAELAGKLPRRDGVNPEAWPVSVQMPELVRKDMAPAAAALQSVVGALAQAIEAHVIDEQVAQDAAVLALGNLGIEVDVAEMRKRIEDEKAEAEKKAAEAPYGGAGAAFGQNGSNGANGNGNGALPPRAAQAIGEALDETVMLALREGEHRAREDKLLDALIATGRPRRKVLERDPQGRLVGAHEEEA